MKPTRWDRPEFNDNLAALHLRRHRWMAALWMLVPSIAMPLLVRWLMDVQVAQVSWVFLTMYGAWCAYKWGAEDVFEIWQIHELGRELIEDQSDEA